MNSLGIIDDLNNVNGMGNIGNIRNIGNLGNRMGNRMSNVCGMNELNCSSLIPYVIFGYDYHHIQQIILVFKTEGYIPNFTFMVDVTLIMMVMLVVVKLTIVIVVETI